jgi:hypothetical protein
VKKETCAIQRCTQSLVQSGRNAKLACRVDWTHSQLHQRGWATVPANWALLVVSERGHHRLLGCGGTNDAKLVSFYIEHHDNRSLFIDVSFARCIPAESPHMTYGCLKIAYPDV